MSDWQDNALNHLHRLTLNLLDAGTAPRKAGMDTGWRRLPATLFETPQNGIWELELEGTPGRTRVHPGNVIVVPAERMHRLCALGPNTMATTYLVVRFEGFAELDLVSSARVPTVLREADGAQIAEDMRALVALRTAARRHIDACARSHALGFTILSRALAHAENTDIGPPPAYTKVQSALTQIRLHLNSPITRSELAETVSLSPTRFHAVFREAMGVAPMVYVRRLRLQHARELLLQTDRAVYEIAENCGFASPYYFCRVFRKYVGQTPTQFRAGFRTG